MKTLRRILKVLGVALLSVLVLIVVAVLLAKYVFWEQLVEHAMDYSERMELLHTCRPYEKDIVEYTFTYKADSAWAKRTREYFQLDTLFSDADDTWTRTLAVARFVSRSIPHANQTVYPAQSNAIALWEYTLNVEPAFNCRLHSIMLHEMLLSLGITNRFVTCQPFEDTGNDCHVVNVVWLPELQKWAMIDSDMHAWATVPDAGGAEDDIPLSLQEMRAMYVAGRPVEFHDLLGEQRDFVGYKVYWSKNLYWFECWEDTGYDRETLSESGECNFTGTPDRGRVVLLVPPGFSNKFIHPECSAITSDDARFWAAPVQ